MRTVGRVRSGPEAPRRAPSVVVASSSPHCARGIGMAIDFTLTPEQKVLQEAARDFAENVLRPVVREADEEPDPLRAFNLTKPAYREAVKGGIAVSMLPKQYGGGGLPEL